MRILYLTEAAAAGVGRHAADLADGIRRRGHVVHFAFSPRRMDNLFRRKLRAMTSDSPSLASYELPLRRGPAPSDWLAGRALMRLVAERGPFDIVHSHSTKAGWVARLALGTAAAHVYTPHAPMTLNPRLPYWQRVVLAAVERKLGAKTAAYIAVSPEESDHLAGIGIPPAKIALIPNGISLRGASSVDRNELRAALGLPADAVSIGFVGRLVDQKNPGLLLDAFARIGAPSDVPVRLVIVGDGPLRPSLERQATALGIAEAVHWAGAVDGRKYMQAFDIFALPSLYEGFPYVLLEAMDTGLAIVSTAVGGTSLLLGRDEGGLIVPPNDAVVFANALRKLALDTRAREELRRSARLRVQGFTVARMVETTERVYISLAAARASKTGALPASEPPLPAVLQP